MINNLLKIDNHAFKIQAASQVYSKQIIPEKYDKTLNSAFAKQDFSFKALASQVQAMAAQDNMDPVGQKFNFLA